MNNDTPFTTVGDEPIEARIVAWVLGEASGFEAAELERLCSERPELLVFRRRMIALHGLLIEAEAVQPADGWKLSPEKRKPIDDISGEKKVVSLEDAKEKRIRRAGIKAFFAIAACVVLAIVVLQLVHPIWIRNEARRSPEKKVFFMLSGDSGVMDQEEASLSSGAGAAGEEADKSEFESKTSNRDAKVRREISTYKPLTTPLPSELIEGTPKPIIVPNLETPVNGPAGMSPMAASKKKSGASTLTLRGNKISKDAPADPFADEKPESSLEASAVSPGAPAPSATPAPTDIAAAESAARSPRPRMIPPPAEKRVFAEDAGSSFAIPDPGDNFDEMSGLGSLSGSGTSGGLGGSGGAKGAGKGVNFDKQSEADSRFSMDITAGSRRRDSDSMDLYGSSSTRSELGRDSLADGKVPTLGDVPLKGKLFSDESGKQKETELPIITTRSEGDDFNGTINYGSPIAAEAGKADAPVTNGNRSGDFANTRNSIDAVLNNPNARADGLKEAESLRKIGKYAEAREALEKTLAANPGDARVVEELKQLGDPIRTNPALTYEHTQNVDDVRRSLYKAEGNLNLGKYDEAKKEYENTLRADPYNQAARRGLEKIAAAKSDYYRAAYDHTRSELLAEVDKAWELAVPADKEGKKANVEIGREFKYPTEYEPPTLSSQTAAGGKAGSSDPAKEDAYRDTSKAAQSGKHSGGVEYELHTGYSSQYLYRGMDLSGSDPDSLRKAIRDQEDKVEERRKLLATIVNTKGIFHKGADKDQGARSSPEEVAIKRGLDAQDYEDAKRDFEKDQALLQQLKLKLASSTKAAEPESPKIDLTKLMEEISASEDPYSTFSLNISDASFKVAQAALAKGERPDPAGVKVEQFYNAVDYGDPSPQNGQPVAVNIEQSTHPVIPGRNLVRVALKTAAAGRSASQPLRLTLLVDQSGSMVREDRRAAMDKALASLSGLLTKNDRVSVIGFARTPRLLAGGMTGDQAGKLKDLVNQTANEGGTNLELAMNVAAKKAMEYKTPGAQNRIVLFTDGAANLGDADPARLAEKVKSLRQSGIAFDIAGIAADELNDDLLGELARNGNGRYYVVGKGDDQDLGKQLAGAFRPAAENVKVQVHFNPERVSRYKLIGFEKDRLKTEDFRNDAVDAAELAAEEAGVAIYQVETIPGGSGEIGEVSVRFRDTAAGQMVERTWAIPHDAKAPSIDRATPSMQLAVLSMLAAEKLKGGPLGEAVDFKQLVDPRANVRRFYGNTGRSAEMLQVIDAIK